MPDFVFNPSRGRSHAAQTGLTLIGLLLVGVLVAAAAAVTVQVVPTVIEYQAVRKAVQKAAEAATPADARAAFDKATQIDAINGLTGADLEVENMGDHLRASLAYQREIALVGPAYLTLKYSAQSR